MSSLWLWAGRWWPSSASFPSRPATMSSGGIRSLASPRRWSHIRMRPVMETFCTCPAPQEQRYPSSWSSMAGRLPVTRSVLRQTNNREFTLDTRASPAPSGRSSGRWRSSARGRRAAPSSHRRNHSECLAWTPVPASGLLINVLTPRKTINWKQFIKSGIQDNGFR